MAEPRGVTTVLRWLLSYSALARAKSSGRRFGCAAGSYATPNDCAVFVVSGLLIASTYAGVSKKKKKPKQTRLKQNKNNLSKVR